MTMEQNDNTLEEMRADYQALKDALAKQEIINDKLLRETMKSRIGGIRSTVTASVVCGILVILFSPLVFHYNPVCGASWWFVAYTDLMMAVCIWFDWYLNHTVQNTDFAKCNLLTFCKDVKKLKNGYRTWMKWCFIPVIIWFAWIAYETWQNSEDLKMAIPLITGILCGIVVGGVIGYRMDRKILKTCDDIISDIEG